MITHLLNGLLYLTGFMVLVSLLGAFGLGNGFFIFVMLATIGRAVYDYCN